MRFDSAMLRSQAVFGAVAALVMLAVATNVLVVYDALQRRRAVGRSAARLRGAS